MIKSFVSRREVRLAVLLLLAGLLVYVRLCFYDFINYDDDSYIYENPYVWPGLTFEGVYFTTSCSVPDLDDIAIAGRSDPSPIWAKRDPWPKSIALLINGKRILFCRKIPNSYFSISSTSTC